MSLSTILLIIWAFLSLVFVLGYGGMLDSVRRWRSTGGVVVFGVVTLGLVTAVVVRGVAYMTPDRQKLIVEGRLPADSISRGYNTKSRFRSLSQPLGHVKDRNGKVLAGYRLRDGHLIRWYPFGAIASHIVGYWTGPLRDGVGVEKALTILNDSLSDDLPHDITLTLDIRLQSDGVKALGSYQGAIVVMEPSTGQVLAAANNPGFDPASVWSDDLWSVLTRDLRTRPLTSRAVKDNFSPGSSIKPLIAAAALHRRSLLPEGRGFVCTGSWTPIRGTTPITEHGAAHGRIDLARAMRVSCNIYFAQLAFEVLGFDATTDYLESLGFNERLHWNTGLALNRFGTLLPSLSWVRGRDRIAESRLGIGQASVKTNPIHFATLLCGIANGGRFLRPTLEMGRRRDTLAWRMESRVATRLEELLREPLLPGGTAFSAFPGGGVRGITIYGKTGTADAEPDGREPSWFVSYGRKNGRVYVVVVAIQNRRGLFAGPLNAPMARRMFESLDRYGYYADGA